MSGGSEGLQRKQGQDQDSEGVICFASTLCNIWRHLGYHNIKSVLTESFIPNTFTYVICNRQNSSEKYYDLGFPNEHSELQEAYVAYSKSSGY